MQSDWTLWKYHLISTSGNILPIPRYYVIFNNYEIIGKLLFNVYIKAIISDSFQKINITLQIVHGEFTQEKSIHKLY